MHNSIVWLKVECLADSVRSILHCPSSNCISFEITAIQSCNDWSKLCLIVLYVWKWNFSRIVSYADPSSNCISFKIAAIRSVNYAWSRLCITALSVCKWNFSRIAYLVSHAGPSSNCISFEIEDLLHFSLIFYNFEDDAIWRRVINDRISEYGEVNSLFGVLNSCWKVPSFPDVDKAGEALGLIPLQ